MCAYWKRGFNQPTTVEPMKYMVPNDHVRLNSYDVPFNAANLGQGNGRRRGEIDPKKTVDNYKKRSETYLKNMREKRKREFLQVGTSTMSPRLPSQQVFIQELSQPLPTISSNDPIDPSLSSLSSSNQEYISATPVEDSLSSIVRETQMPTPRINTPQNNQQPEQQLLSQPPPPPPLQPPHPEYDQLKQTMIRQLLDEGANEETIYQALSRLEQARRRKQDQPNQQIQQQQSTSAKTTLNNQYEPASIPLKSSYIPASTSAPATIDVFNLSSHPISPRDRYKTRRHFNTSKHMTGLIGPDSISNIRKKLISPRDNIEGGSGGHYRELIPHRSINRKRPIENQTNRLYQAKNWTDVSDYPSELPPSRSPRNSKKKESPRAHNQFGQKRVLFDAQTNNQKIGYQFNSLTSGPQKRKDGYSSRQFSERKKGYNQSMDKWETTQAVSTLMVKPSGSSDVEY